MARQKMAKETKKALLNARGMIENIAEAGSNEAVTRQRIEKIFETCMGFNVLKHITPEYAVHGVGDAEYCDLAIRLDENSAPEILVEIKRVTTDLSTKHLKQVATYAINKGCEWALLTNGREWRLYHISFDQPPQTTLVEFWNVLSDDLTVLADKFSLVCYKSLKRDSLKQLWIKSNILTNHNILKTILSGNSISLIRRSLKRTKKGVAVSPEEVVGAIRRLLNESALAELENIKISLAYKKPRRKSTPKRSAVQEDKTQKSEIQNP
jgi:predicted type IV restriction endonuclease